MLKKLLINTLLKRGASQLEEVVGKGVRHLFLSSGGASLLTHGYATGNEIEQLAGALGIVAGILLSVARVWIQKKL